MKNLTSSSFGPPEILPPANDWNKRGFGASRPPNSWRDAARAASFLALIWLWAFWYSWHDLHWGEVVLAAALGCVAFVVFLLLPGAALNSGPRATAVWWRRLLWWVVFFAAFFSGTHIDAQWFHTKRVRSSDIYVEVVVIVSCSVLTTWWPSWSRGWLRGIIKRFRRRSGWN